MGKRKSSKITFSAGSALILAVVLTSLLAIVGTIFLMAARVDKIATSAIAEHRELDFAVEAVIAKISRELVLDVPGMSGNPEYYDYPGDKDRWLASLEPYEDGTTYRWRQISDVTGFLEDNHFEVEDVSIDPPYVGKYINDYPVITLDSRGELEERWADADGDGIADSKWIELDDMTSGKGKHIYAAIRVIDNGGMINVNTGYEFDPGASRERIDGSSLTQINLGALAESLLDTIDDIHNERARGGSSTLADYERDCIWRIEDPNIDYMPFDIFDEVELRNRYFLTSLAQTRLEETWYSTIGHHTFKRVPYDGQGIYDDDHWWEAISQLATQPDKRHFLTTHNFDRIIDPCGVKMLNINDANVSDVYRTVRNALDKANFGDANDTAAQLAVNLIDYQDGPNEPNVTTYTVNGKTYYGFESPCIYISELAHRFTPNPSGGPVGSNTFRSYAVELYKPYPEDAEPNNRNQWRLFIDNSDTGIPGNEIVDIDWADGADFHVIRWHNPVVELNVDSAASSYDKPNTYNKMFDADSVISLQRRTRADNGRWVTVDSIQVPNVSGGWLRARDGTALGIQRDITLHKNIRRLWSNQAYMPTLGEDNNYEAGDSIYIQAHPADKKFTNVGEVGMVFREDVYGRTWNSADTDADVRLDLAVPAFGKILKYFTRFDPTRDGIDNDGDGEGEGTGVDVDELKIPGRININTAPSYVMAQLPWIRYGDSTPFEKAEAICDYRDNTLRGFESIGGLMQVTEMGYCASLSDSGDLAGLPDLTALDGAEDDFEERDVIFARISDLVTVRSDVFTAYILVRIGTDGPQKRVIAVLDRSNVYSGGGKVKVAVLHPVPDPR